MASEAIPILESFSTQSLHQFKVAAGNTFDDPVTPEGKLWRGALTSISKVDGWSVAWWGRREECIEDVELILGILPNFLNNSSLGLLARGCFRPGLAQQGSD